MAAYLAPAAIPTVVPPARRPRGRAARAARFARSGAQHSPASWPQTHRVAICRGGLRRLLTCGETYVFIADGLRACWHFTLFYEMLPPS